MRYTAAALTAAARPVTVSIPVAGRVGASWLGRWWTRRFRTWAARPISTPQMLALQATSGDVLQYAVALAGVLRAVFPASRLQRLVSDPVRIILQLPAELQRSVLQALVTVPGSGIDESRQSDDPIERARQAQRGAVHGAARARGAAPSLAIAALTVRAAFGESWYYAPQRWATVDGYAPFGVAWLEYVGLQALEARQRLAVADGYALANAKDVKAARLALQQAAYPTDLVS